MGGDPVAEDSADEKDQTPLGPYEPNTAVGKHPSWSLLFNSGSIRVQYWSQFSSDPLCLPLQAWITSSERAASSVNCVTFSTRMKTEPGPITAAAWSITTTWRWASGGLACSPHTCLVSLLKPIYTSRRHHTRSSSVQYFYASRSNLLPQLHTAFQTIGVFIISKMYLFL